MAQSTRLLSIRRSHTWSSARATNSISTLNFSRTFRPSFGGAYTTTSTQIFAVVTNPLIAVNPIIPVFGDTVSARLVASRRSFAMLIGGGLDWKVSKHMQVRPVAFDYFMVQPESLITGQTRERNNWRYSAGVNFTFGAR